MRLTEEVRRFVVVALACYDTPTKVAKDVAERFDVKLPRQTVERYDAERLGQKPAKKWVKLFNLTRAHYSESLADIPIAQKAVRLRRLDRMSRRAEEKGNDVLAAQFLEQAAKECGGMYTNRRELTGPDGVPFAPPSQFDGLSDEDMAKLAVQLARGYEGQSGGAT